MENQCNRIMLYRKNLKRKLTPMRYGYSLSVSHTCMNLAMRCGYDLDKAELAGLLHDYGKQYSDDIALKKCLKHGLEVTGAEYRALPMLHAEYGAWLAKHGYRIASREILDVTGCRATGRLEMTTLDKILYIADYIEPRRYEAEDLPRIRRLAYEDLDGAVYAILAGTLDYLKGRGRNIDPLTTRAYEYFKIGNCETSSQS